MSRCRERFVLFVPLSLSFVLAGCGVIGFDDVANGSGNGSTTNRSCGEAVEFGTNAIANGGAEAGDASDGEVVEVTCWSREKGCFTAMSYKDGYGGFDSVRPPNAGDNLLSGGKDCDQGNSTSTGIQTLGSDVLSNVAGDLSSGGVNFELSGYLGGWEAQDDAASVSVRFLDDSGTEMSTTSIGPVGSAARQSETSFVERSASGTVPSGTASVEIVMNSEKTGGSNNDGVADNLRLVFSN